MLLQEKRVAPKDAEDRKGWVKMGADERTENAIFFENTRSLESITRPQEASESDSERLSMISLSDYQSPNRGGLHCKSVMREQLIELNGVAIEVPAVVGPGRLGG
jgi:hypothetical protein